MDNPLRKWDGSPPRPVPTHQTAEVSGEPLTVPISQQFRTGGGRHRLLYDRAKVRQLPCHGHKRLVGFRIIKPGYLTKETSVERDRTSPFDPTAAELAFPGLLRQGTSVARSTTGNNRSRDRLRRKHAYSMMVEEGKVAPYTLSRAILTTVCGTVNELAAGSAHA